MKRSQIKQFRHKKQVRHIGNKFLSATEINVQEAVYLALQMPLRRSSRGFVLVNTSHPDERTFLLKYPEKLKDLPSNSTDIASDNLIKRCQRRPETLENLCLADFAALFDIQYHKAKLSMEKSAKDDLLPEDQIEVNLDDDTFNTGENDYE